MKKVLLFSAATISVGTGLKAETEELKSRELEEVVINATKATEGTPMAFTDVTKESLKKNNFGQDIPYLISQTPNVIGKTQIQQCTATLHLIELTQRFDHSRRSVCIGTVRRRSTVRNGSSRQTTVGCGAHHLSEIEMTGGG